ncbi:MAG: hypothetical protein ACK58L_07585, partial [Planctomycetota bacterium]
LVELDSSIDAKYSLSDEGKLLVIGDQPDKPVLARHELGRVVILPAGPDLEAWFSMPEQTKRLGQIVGFLWKVLSDSRVHSGELWGKSMDFSVVMQRLRQISFSPEEDSSGVYLTKDQEIVTAERNGWIIRKSNNRAYVNLELFGDRTEFHSLAPRNEALLQTAETALLPDDIEMVPTWVFGLILTAYVLTIGPVDYFVLGRFRLRKLTWILFPVVTLFYTAFTVFVAWAYMASDDTGGTLTITDLGTQGRPLRQTTLETFYFGSSLSVERDLRNSLIVQGEQIRGDHAFADPNAEPPKIPFHSPPACEGNSPQNYRFTQSVEQWSPLTIRSLSLEPENVLVPEMNWDDSSLVTTSDGIARLQTDLRRLADPAKGRHVAAAIYHRDFRKTVINVPETERQLVQIFDENGNRRQVYQSAADALFEALPVSGRDPKVSEYLYQRYIMPGFFRLVSHTSPTGCATLEDLNILDPTDHRQHMLVVLIAEGENMQVFRKLYFAD